MEKAFRAAIKKRKSDLLSTKRGHWPPEYHVVPPTWYSLFVHESIKLQKKTPKEYHVMFYQATKFEKARNDRSQKIHRSEMGQSYTVGVYECCRSCTERTEEFSNNIIIYWLLIRVNLFSCYVLILNYSSSD